MFYYLSRMMKSVEMKLMAQPYSASGQMSRDICWSSLQRRWLQSLVVH